MASDVGELVNGVLDDVTQVVAPVLDAVVPSSPPVVAEPAPAPPAAPAPAPRPAPEPAPIADPDPEVLGLLNPILEPAEQVLQPVQQILTSVDVVLVDALSVLEPVTAGLDQLVTDLLDETVDQVVVPVLELGRDTADDRRLGLPVVLPTSSSSPLAAPIAPAAAQSATPVGADLDRPGRDDTDRTATSPVVAPLVESAPIAVAATAVAPIAVAPLSPDSDPDSAPAHPAPATLPVPTGHAGHETAAAALDGAATSTSDSGAVVDQLDIRTSSITAHEPTSSPD